MLIPKPEGDFTPPPPGNHPARCYRVVDLGTQQGSYMGKPKIQHKIMIGWELFCDEKLPDGRNFTISSRYTLSGSDRSMLRQHLEAWRGRAFGEDDWNTFHIEKIIGQPCLLQVKHETKDGTTYSNIASVAGVPKGFPVPDLTNDTLFFSLGPKEYQKAAYEKLSDNLKLTVHKSPEWAVLNGNGHDHEQEAPVRDAMDDEIPF